MQRNYAAADNATAESIVIAICAFVIVCIVLAIRNRLQKDKAIRTAIHIPAGSPPRDPAEVNVERAMAEFLYKDGYIIFGNLIIPSVSRRIPSTQIDHVIVSVHGIFCIETKSHQGNIYGGSRYASWRQYLGPNKYSLYNPIRQNKHHVKSLEYLLRTILKAPIHSYVVFAYASKVMLDGDRQNMTVGSVVRQIRNHTRLVYSLDDVEKIAEALAYVSSKSEAFEDAHIEAVTEYVQSKK